MRVPSEGVQRTSSHPSWRFTAFGLAIALIAAMGIVAPTPVSAASDMKVVVIVGPVGSSTSDYRASARRYADRARSYGADVVEIYSPNATWKKVKAAAQGANVLIYLGHGNGSPSPYGPFSKYTKDGFGLNKRAGHGNNNTKYWGEYYVKTQINLARNAVVILNRLCYASGNSEWGTPNPTKKVAKKRVDNFGAGFLRAGARAVFAEGTSDASYILDGLLNSSMTIGEIFQSSGAWSGDRDFKFDSRRTDGFRVWMDPKAPRRYYRSVVGKFDLEASAFRAS